MGYQTSDNLFSPTKFIVDAVAQEGVFTTIQAAINAATYGTDIFIRPGTYTENILLKDGVNLTSFTRDVNIVQINGTITMNTAGTVNISGITVQTNGATAVSFSSANLQNLTFTNCVLTSTNADLITNSNSNSSSIIFFQTCNFTVAATYKLFAVSNASGLTFRDCSIVGASTTASTSTSSARIVFFQGSNNQTLSITGTGVITFYGTAISTGNQTFLTMGTGTTASVYDGRISTGNAIPFNITSTGVVFCLNASIETTAATINTGTGTFYNGSNAYGSTGVAVTSTNVALVGTAFTKVNVQTFTGNGTYTPTAGMKWCTVEVVGGGGGGGGASTTAAGECSASSGGGGGEYRRGTISAATIGASQTVTIGTAGTAGAAGNNAGGTGGTTSLGVLISASGGGGGGGALSAATQLVRNGGVGGQSGSGGDFSARGNVATGAFSLGSSNLAFASPGANSQFGSGGVFGQNATGGTASSYGAGGGGTAITVSQTGRAGGAGSAGICIVTEYI